MFTGNALEENRCVRCQAVLIDLNAKWHMCSKCIKETENDMKRIHARKKEDKDIPQRKKMWIPMLAKKK